MFVSLSLATPALGQVVFASAVKDTQTHGWAVYKNSKDEVLLVHIPPRDSNQSGSIPIKPAEPGELHAVRTLSKMPDAIAAIDDRVYLVFPQVYDNGVITRRVFSGRAIGSPIGSAWGFMPTDRLDAQPAISIPSRSIRVLATTKALWVLLDGDHGYTLLKMTDSAWEPIVLPSPTDADSTNWVISAQGARLILIDRSDPTVMRPFALAEDDSGWSELDWERIPVPKGDYELLAGIQSIKIIDHDQDQRTRVRAWSKSGVFTLAAGLDLPVSTRFAMLESVNHLVGIAQRTPDPSAKKADGATSSTVQIFEVDLSDASMLYAGDPVVTVPVSDAEFRFLVGMMILIMVGVLVVVILPDKSDAMQIPDHFALADPGRRLVATLIDVFLVSFFVGMIFDVRVIEILTLSVIVRSDTSWLVIPMVLVMGIVSMSIFEWLLGATPGKLLMGIRVVRAQSGPMERIPFWAAIVRNMIKWLLPPVAALALIDPESLHRGDRVTRTLVVVPIEHPAEPGDGDRKD